MAKDKTAFTKGRLSLVVWRCRTMLQPRSPRTPKRSDKNTLKTAITTKASYLDTHAYLSRPSILPSLINTFGACPSLFIIPSSSC